MRDHICVRERDLQTLAVALRCMLGVGSRRGDQSIDIERWTVGAFAARTELRLDLHLS
jgi:hypothetical protein